MAFVGAARWATRCRCDASVRAAARASSTHAHAHAHAHGKLAAATLPTVLMFPGQGAQRVGMGGDLAAAFAVSRATFDEVDDALRRRLSHLMWNGSQAELTLTRNAQPALLAFCIALHRAIESVAPGVWRNVGAVMGHSVGEYAALVAVGALPLAAAARLLEARGDAMQAAADAAQGARRSGMTALLLRPHRGGDAAAAWAAFRTTVATITAAVDAERVRHGDGAVLAVASINSPQQVVLAGDADGMAAVAAALKADGAIMRAVPLDVSAPFHTPLMAPAADAVAAGLRSAAGGGLAPAGVPLVAGVNAAHVTAPADLRAALLDGITAPVRWADCVAAVLVAPLPRGAAAHHLLELAPAPTVAALSKQCDSGGVAAHSSVASAADVYALAAALASGSAAPVT